MHQSPFQDRCLHVQCTRCLNSELSLDPLDQSFLRGILTHTNLNFRELLGKMSQDNCCARPTWLCTFP
eukprot:m.140408 g.140408  ORF g.140408 m.140408 type:complete len:68 (-) comp15961_c2_seq6:417-620(-)